MSLQGLKVAHVLIFGVICLLLLIVLLLRKIPDTELEKYTTLFPGSQNSALKHDCDVEVIYSINDRQCSRICKPPGTYVSKNGICVNMLAFNHQAVENECDPEKGVLAYLVGDPQLGRTNLLCLSIDPGIQPDDINDRNIICTNGTVKGGINYVKSFPQLKSCTCGEGMILTFISNTSSIRSRGICVPASSSKAYQFNKLIFDPNHV